MSFLKKHLSTVILCIFEILIGILLLIDPIQFTSGIIIAFGIVMLIIGLMSVIRYFRLEAGEAAVDQALVKGLIALALGIFCVWKTGWFILTFPLLTIVYGIAVLIAGFAKVQWTVDLLRLHSGRWILPAISALISILAAVIILENPFASTVVLWMFTGISLIVEALLDVLALIILGKRPGQE